MQRILIPTDFSSNAWNAISYALQLFKNQKCHFFLLNTYTPVIPNSRFMAPMAHGLRIEDAIRCTSENGLAQTLERIYGTFHNPQHSFETISSFNLLTDEVAELVDRFEIDLIVTGTKGASGMDEIFMGSNTVRIIKSAKKCPVLAIPQHFEFITPSEIAFATDLKRFYSRSELQPMLALAKAFKSSIRIVHVQYKIKALTEMQQFNLNMLHKYFGEVPHYLHTVSELHSVSETLEIFSKELDIHLLALLHYQHSYAEKLTREPVIKKTAFHTQVPLLVIPELSLETSMEQIANDQVVLR